MGSNRAVVDKPFLRFFFLRLLANFFDRPFVVFFGVAPKRAGLAFGAALAGISWMVAKVRIIFDRRAAQLGEEKVTSHAARSTPISRVRGINNLGRLKSTYYD